MSKGCSYLANREECSTEDDVTNGPSVLKCPEHEDQLRDDIDESANERPEDVNDPKTDGLVVFEASELLEGGDCNEERDTPNSKAGNPEELEGPSVQAKPLAYYGVPIVKEESRLLRIGSRRSR